MAGRQRTRSPAADRIGGCVELPPAEELERLKLSPEVAWYLVSRGIPLSDCPPLIKTPEPGETCPGARFDPERVDKVLKAFGLLRHTKGKWAGSPLRPDSWQVAYILAPWAGWVRFDEDAGRWVRVIRELYVDLPRKNGKALPVDTPLLTANRGWTTMGEVRPGDLVFHPSGQPVEVTAVSDVMVGHDCYRVTTTDGRSLVADAEHLWTVTDKRRAHSRGTRAVRSRWFEQRTCTTADLLVGGLTRQARESARPRSLSERRYALPRQHPLITETVDLPLDPYLLGAWLGDGHARGARLTCSAEDMPHWWAAIAAAGFLPTRGKVANAEQLGMTCAPGVGRQRRSFGGKLVELGLVRNKHVPPTYLTAGREQREAVLQGLLDTDGTIDARRGQVEFCTTSDQLARDVLFLARSLGWRATCVEHRAMFNGTDHGPKYRVCFTVAREDASAPFRLPRKAARVPETRTDSRFTVTIASIEPVPSVPVRCIVVDAADGLFLAGRDLVATHNSTTLGGIAVYMTAADGESGAEVIAAATTTDQAGFVFAPVKALVENAPALKPHLRAYAKRIVHPASASYFQAISSVADAQHGANIHCAVIDELHVHKTPDMVETLETGTGSRDQPLVATITTADDGKPNTIYGRKRKRIEQLAARLITDSTVYGVIWAAEPSDDPFAEETWRKANPGFGISPTRSYLAKEAAKAKDSPADLAKFQRLHLGLRTKQDTRYIELAAWDDSAGMVDESKLAGRACHGGLDLASVSDVTALCWDFPGEDEHEAIWRFWIPEDRLEDLDRRTAKNASAWVKAGWLKTTPGNVIDNDFIVDTIVKDAGRFDVKTIGYDRWGATDVVRRLGDAGLTCVPIGQGYASLSAPLKELLRLVLTKRYRHGGNPVMRWMVDNLAVQMDAAGNVKPDKAVAAEKIDGVSAAVVALKEYMDAEAAEDVDSSVFVFGRGSR